MKVAWFDCFAGVAGDMTLGALIDLGVPREHIDEAVRGLGVTGFSLTSEVVRKHGIAGVKVDVRLTDPQPERHLSDIEAILNKGTLIPAVRERALRVFRRLTEAEARVHQIPIERVHLHEVGALDAIVDVVGACAGLHALGIEQVIASEIVTGFGMTHAEHGAIPIPGPATLELLKGIPVRPGPVEAEMTTPTGAALLATLAQSFGPMPTMQVLATGYGAGTRSFEALPNLLRVVVGEVTGAGARTDGEEGTAVVVEANLDDLSPQVLSHVQTLLLERGALDVWTQSVVMKKGRSGHVLSVLARPADADDFVRLLFAETTTIGVRISDVRRRTLERRFESVTTQWGVVRIKVASSAGLEVNAQPEFEDCAAIAMKCGVPLKEVQAAAIQAFRGRRPESAA